MATRLEVKVKKGDINRALKQLKSKVIKTRMMREIRDNQFYKKDSERRREEINKAKYVEKKFKREE